MHRFGPAASVSFMLMTAPLVTHIARKGAARVVRIGVKVVAAKGAVRFARNAAKTGTRLAALSLLLRLTRPWA